MLYFLHMEKIKWEWVLVVIGNLFIYSALFNKTSPFVNHNYFYNIIIISIPLFLTIGPVLLSKSKYKNKDTIGYSLPGILVFLDYLLFLVC